MPEEAETTTETIDAPPRSEAVSELTERFTRGLEKVAPLPKQPTTQQPSSENIESQAPPPSIEEPPPPAPEKPKPKPRKEAEPPPSAILPSFLQKDAAPEKPAETPPTEEEWPEKPPTRDAKGGEVWKNFRSQYKARGEKLAELTGQLAALQAERGKPDEATSNRLKELEQQNAHLLTITERVSLENHPRFQAEVLQPRAAALEYAKGIIQDSGGDPTEFERAMGMKGQGQIAALEQLYTNLPEITRGELSAVIKDIRLLDRKRDQILSDPSRSMETIRRQDIAAQQEMIQQSQRELDNTLANVITHMREVSKVEVLQRSNDPKDKWWNDQVDRIEAAGRDIATTHDQRKLMAACVMAPMVDVYRRLWFETNKQMEYWKSRATAANSHEPTIDGEVGETPKREDVKKEIQKPIGQAFREILNANRNRQ